MRRRNLLLPLQLETRVQMWAIERAALDLPLVRVAAAHAMLHRPVKPRFQLLPPHLQRSDRLTTARVAPASKACGKRSAKGSVRVMVGSAALRTEDALIADCMRYLLTAGTGCRHWLQALNAEGARMGELGCGRRAAARDVRTS